MITYCPPSYMRRVIAHGVGSDPAGRRAPRSLVRRRRFPEVVAAASLGAVRLAG